MKTALIALSALFLLAACETPAKTGGCAECEKMAIEAKAKHDAEKAAAQHGKGCECCKGKKH